MVQRCRVFCSYARYPAFVSLLYLSLCVFLLSFSSSTLLPYALYLWAIMQNMPTVLFTRRREETGFVEMWECEWRRLKKTSSQVQQSIDSKFRRPQDPHKTLTEVEIVSAIRNKSLFGEVECDIRVPDALKPAFAEMPPIFKNTDISRDDIGEYMKAFAEKQKIMSRPRRSLIGSYFGEKILLATPLIKWYMEHGLELTHTYQVIEYTPMPCFKPFVEAAIFFLTG